MNSPIWGVLKSEIEERDAYIMQLMRIGDDKWTDGEMRARLNELEYILQTPRAIILELELQQRNKQTREMDHGEDDS